jgi:hypothetical protein
VVTLRDQPAGAALDSGGLPAVGGGVGGAGDEGDHGLAAEAGDDDACRIVHLQLPNVGISSDTPVPESSIFLIFRIAIFSEIQKYGGG